MQPVLSVFFLSLTLLIPINLLGSTRTCIDFGDPQITGSIERDAISESSGLAVSRDHLDTLWTHNDSGDAARIFALSTMGGDYGTILFTSATAEDWESMSLGPCNAATCLFLGDVGDNESKRETISVWRVTEPTPPGEDKESIVVATGLTLTYPEGAMDCEAIAVDPLTGDMLFIEKSWSAEARVHLLPKSAWESSRDSIELSYLATIDFDTDSLTGGLVTGADISPSGTSLFARTYVAGFHIPILRNESGSITGFDAVVQDEVYTDGQCEAIAFNESGMALWFTCEDENGPVGRSDCLTWRNDDSGETTTDEPSGCHGAAPPAWLFLILLYCKMRISSPNSSSTDTVPP